MNTLSLGENLEKAASIAPHKIAIVEGEKRKTFKELDTMATALAASLQGLGIRKGDRIAIYMKSSIEFVVSFYAIEKLGGIVAWVNANYRKTEAEFILRNSEAKGIVIFREWEGYDYLDAVLKMKENLPGLEFTLLVGEGEGEKIWCFNDLLNRGYGKSFRPPRPYEIEDYARCLIGFMDALDIGKATVVGDHTGAAIAVEAAVGHPALLDRLVLSGCPHYTPEERKARLTDPRYATRMEIKEDGSHLLRIWGIPKSLAPHSKPGSWHRVLVDYLVAGVHAIDAWHAVFKYDIERRLPLIKCPTLLISGSEDVFLHRLEASASLIPRCRTKVIEGGGDVIAYQRFKPFAEAIVEFISNP